MAQHEVRTLSTDEELAGFLTCMRTAFLEGKDVTDEQVAWVRERYDLSRTWSAFEDGVLCGTAHTFATRLRLPGLGEVPVSALTQVTVLPTHTRRGHLSRMMRAQLEHAVEAGELASVLIAAEWPIYGRFGYGPATDWVEWEVDTATARFVAPPVGRCRLVDAAELEKVAVSVLARQQAVTPGSIGRPDWHVALIVGSDLRPGFERKQERVRVVHVGEDGEPDGFAVYDPKERWDGMRSASSLAVDSLIAVDAVAERELWRYLLDVDLVEQVAWAGSPASAVRWALADGRAARQEGRWDHVWARILDVPACLTARSYARADRLVVEVLDGFLGRGGRFALDAGPDGADCAPTREPADLTLPVAAIGAAWLGGTDLRDVALAGGVDEHTPGAADRLATLLRWHQTPWCSTGF